MAESGSRLTRTSSSVSMNSTRPLATRSDHVDPSPDLPCNHTQPNQSNQIANQSRAPTGLRTDSYRVVQATHVRLLKADALRALRAIRSRDNITRMRGMCELNSRSEKSTSSTMNSGRQQRPASEYSFSSRFCWSHTTAGAAQKHHQQEARTVLHEQLVPDTSD